MGEAVDYVNSGFNQSASYAADAWQLIQSYVNEILDNSSTSVLINIDKDIAFDPALTTGPLTAELPSSPSFPAVPTIEDNFVMPDVPSKPDVTMPDKPTLREHVIPDFQGDISIPQFTSTLPDVDLPLIEEADVRALFGEMVGNYAPQISEIKDLLLLRITEGGTGLPVDVEAQIWNRNLERDEQALQDSVDAAAAQWAKMGFTLPDGALADSLASLNNEYINKRLDTSRDIAIKQAELEQANINTALQLVASIEEAFNNVMAQYANVSVNAMKTAADVSVSLYNSHVTYYNLLTDMYNAKANVYSTLVNARLADVEVYKAQVEGVGLAIKADESKIDIYVAEISAESEKLKAYETELRGIMAQIEATKAWLDVGKTRMELFATETRALNDRFAGQIDGFKSEVFAWSTEGEQNVKEKDISLRAQATSIEACIKEAELVLKSYEWRTQLEVQKMESLANTGAHVVAGALAAAHASARISESEDTSIQVTAS